MSLSRDNVEGQIISSSGATFVREIFVYTPTVLSTIESVSEFEPDQISDIELRPDLTPSTSNDTKAEFTGWRAFFYSILCFTIFMTPWAIGMILSWVPVSRIGLAEMPEVITVNIVFSTIEVAAILLHWVYACCFQLVFSDHARPMVMPSWLTLYIHLSAIATGIYTLYESLHLTCEAGNDSPECRVGKPFIRVIGCFRLFGIIGAVIIALWLSYQLRKHALESHRRQNARSQDAPEV